MMKAPLRGKGICAYYDQMAVMTKWAVANAPPSRPSASGLPYADSGASSLEEVGSCSLPLAYLRAMEERGISVNEGAAHALYGLHRSQPVPKSPKSALREPGHIVKECGRK
ncbi:MAG: hypothetical protein ACLT8E_07505 [Akkermansia sp.]